MATAANIAEEYFEAWNQRNFVRLRQLFHPQYSYTGGDGRVQAGPDAGLAVAEVFAVAFPDGRLDIQRIHHVSDDLVVTELVGRGTQDGDLMGVAPTGRQVTVPICNVIEVRDDQIYAEREYMDMLHLFGQLGGTPAMPIGSSVQE